MCEDPSYNVPPKRPEEENKVPQPSGTEKNGWVKVGAENRIEAKL
jgi:hypothetical protein